MSGFYYHLSSLISIYQIISLYFSITISYKSKHKFIENEITDFIEQASKKLCCIE